jgi:alkylation response protein AidB-like acyl-CoA dehydrogenase
VSHPTQDSVRLEISEWLVANWDPDLSLVDWRTRLLEAGWAVPSWPTRWFGRDLPVWADRVAADEVRAHGAVHTPVGAGMNLAAPTILEHGSDELRERLLRPTLTGEITWCQLFSEPGAGSDLAGLRTSAVRDGDEWIINGQKVWNTSAHHADMGILLARTDPTAGKHAGISYFCLPMQQPGIEVRPIVQMNRHQSFTEVFMTDARVPAANLVGELGGGWKVALTTLSHERSFATLKRPQYGDGEGGAPVSRALAEAEAEAEEYFKTYVWYPQRAGRPDLVMGRAQTMGRSTDAIVRQDMADLLSFSRASQWTAERARAARQLGRPPGAEGSLGKLAASEVARHSSRVHSVISGAQAMLTEGPDPSDSIVAEVLVSTPAQSIAGGTDEIQHNIIGERILGLPREPSPDPTAR